MTEFEKYIAGTREARLALVRDTAALQPRDRDLTPEEEACYAEIRQQIKQLTALVERCKDDPAHRLFVEHAREMVRALTAIVG